MTKRNDWEDPRAMTREGWIAWEARMREAHPWQFWWRWTLRIWWRRVHRRGSDCYWWFRHRLDPRHRYHVLHLGLPPGYYDPDTRILYAVMGVVTEFVGLTRGVVDWAADPEHAAAWEVFTEATAWWPRYQAAIAEPTCSLEDRNRWEAEADAHLVAIIGKRGYLWC